MDNKSITKLSFTHLFAGAVVKQLKRCRFYSRHIVSDWLVLPTFRPVQEKNSAADEKNFVSSIISLFEEIWASEKHYFCQYECEKKGFRPQNCPAASFSARFDLCGRTIGQLATRRADYALKFCRVSNFTAGGGWVKGIVPKSWRVNLTSQ